MHCHEAQIISDWFLEHDNEFTLLKWPPQSPDLSPIEQLWDVEEREIHIMNVQTTNLQQLRDAINSICTKISEECLQHLVESMPRRIKTVLKANPVLAKCTLIKWPVCIYVYIKYGNNKNGTLGHYIFHTKHSQCRVTKKTNKKTTTILALYFALVLFVIIFVYLFIYFVSKCICTFLLSFAHFSTSIHLGYFI